MSTQELAALAIVMLALAYWLRGIVKTGRGSPKGCASGCGKCSVPADSKVAGRIRLPQV